MSSNDGSGRSADQARAGNPRPASGPPLFPRTVGRPARLTVLIPHFDSARFLGMAVRSVLNQEFRDISVLVVDDASPRDDWIDALLPFRHDERLTVLRTEGNVGHYRIKNALLPHVRSRYVGFQDADDISHPRRFARQVRMLDRGRADVVGCDFECVDEAGTPYGRQRMVRNANLWMRAGKSFTVMHPASVVRREVLERLGGFDGTARVAADTDFYLRAAHLFRLRNVRGVLYRHRRWPGSLTARPDTGFGSPLRDAYARAMRERERTRRQVRSRRGNLLPLLQAPPNDIDVALEPVRLGSGAGGARGPVADPERGHGW
jgi:glycosyltransferase involved in cell wall biosynthesis